jgi:hypothetical protein
MKPVGAQIKVVAFLYNCNIGRRIAFGCPVMALIGWQPALWNRGKIIRDQIIAFVSVLEEVSSGS